jgi:hypothetical protein
MEPKLNFIIACDKASFDKTGKFNIVGGFNQISANGVPALISGISIIAEVEMSAGNHVARLVFREEGSDDQSLIEGADNIVKPTNGAHRTIFDINNLLVKKEGRYVFDYYLDDAKVGESAVIEFKIN